ncbi:hypothetical protein DFJ74DRAFT_730784 [Hyaloraphidium curvatum]|nr:hypothetical protein DFJ74DRAFT_730784 [Hyaloraphidium curvatum]
MAKTLNSSTERSRVLRARRAEERRQVLEKKRLQQRARRVVARGISPPVVSADGTASDTENGASTDTQTPEAWDGHRASPAHQLPRCARAPGGRDPRAVLQGPADDPRLVALPAVNEAGGIGFGLYVACPLCPMAHFDSSPTATWRTSAAEAQLILQRSLCGRSAAGTAFRKGDVLGTYKGTTCAKSSCGDYVLFIQALGFSVDGANRGSILRFANYAQDHQKRNAVFLGKPVKVENLWGARVVASRNISYHDEVLLNYASPGFIGNSMVARLEHKLDEKPTPCRLPTPVVKVHRVRDPGDGFGLELNVTRQSAYEGWARSGRRTRKPKRIWIRESEVPESDAESRRVISGFLKGHRPKQPTRATSARLLGKAKKIDV